MVWRGCIPIVGCIIHVLTVVTCYGLTYKHGLHEWVLSLSTIGENGPQRTIFTAGHTIAGVAYLFTTLILYDTLRRTLSFLEGESLIMLKSAHKLRILSLVSACSGCIGSFLLCLVGLRIYVDADIFVLSPYIFFVACMCMNTLLGYMMKRRRTFFYFFVLSLCGVFSLVIALFFGLSDNLSMQVMSSVASYILLGVFFRFVSLYFHDLKNANFIILDRLVTNIYGTPFSQNVSVNTNV
jgi:hypothetical protein